MPITKECWVAKAFRSCWKTNSNRRDVQRCGQLHEHHDDDDDDGTKVTKRYEVTQEALYITVELLHGRLITDHHVHEAASSRGHIQISRSFQRSSALLCQMTSENGKILPIFYSFICLSYAYIGIRPFEPFGVGAHILRAHR